MNFFFYIKFMLNVEKLCVVSGPNIKGEVAIVTYGNLQSIFLIFE